MGEYIPRLKTKLDTEVAAKLQEKFNYSSKMEVPRLLKVVINMGVGLGDSDPKQIEGAVRDLTAISGQKPVVCVARKAISNFKIREGHKIGTKVTLRGNAMYDFLDKWMTVALARVRDFQGLSLKSFDGRGNFSTGMKDQTVFPEISYDTVDRVRGLDICVVTSAKTDEEARELLRAMGVPFEKK